ncbi:NAD(P)-dependent oxidoreductase [Cytophagaceae bacterium ABcell3]|nr:NAD(P)-dependent oxidoreductase [Cytophagaceae bacterium ABcell3]
MTKERRKFKQIVCLDNTKLEDWALNALKEISITEPRVYQGYPDANDENEIRNRIENADCVLVSLNTPMSANVLSQCQNLEYIGLCCSLLDRSSCNVDVEEAARRGIEVRGVKDYADEGVVEFLFGQLISLAKGLHGIQWKDRPTELHGKSLGVIGLGTLGKMVAKTALAFGMKVYYYSRTRKKGLESENLVYLPLNDLLPTVDVVSTHLPRNNRLLGKQAFSLMKENSVLVNTSLGPTYEIDAFEAWIGRGISYAIVDSDGARGHEALLRKYKNVIYSDKSAGGTDMAYKRLSQKVLQNAYDYLGKP